LYIGVDLAAECGEDGLDLKHAGDTDIHSNKIHGFRECTATCGGSGSKGGGIIVHVDSDDIRIFDNEFYDISGPPLRFNTASQTVDHEVYRNVFHSMAAEVTLSNEWRSMLKLDGGSEVLCYYNTFSGNHGSGTNLFYFQAGATVTLKGNIFDDGGAKDDAGASVTSDYNCWSNGTTQHYVGANDITPADAEFVNPGADDYRIESNSPCLDAGVVISPFTDGFWGDDPDMGFYEWVPAEDVSITDSPLLDLTSLIGESESISLLDIAELSVQILPLAISEAVSLSDTAIAFVSGHVATVTESIAVTEFIDALITNVRQASESVSISENIQAALIGLLIDLSESISISENIEIDVLSEREIVNSENISLLENVGAIVSDANVAISEAVFVGETLVMVIPAVDIHQVIVSENVIASESADGDSGEPAPFALDTVSINEAVLLEIVLETSVALSESITLSETTALTVTSFEPLAIENISISDTALVSISEPLKINANEAIAVTENILMAMLLSSFILSATYKKMR
jgi:hypothetical protein